MGMTRLSLNPSAQFAELAAPAAARNTRPSHSERAKPKAAIATPHNAAAHVIASPWRRTPDAQPDVSAAIMAPSDGAA